jgi:hypothetical protein
MKNRILTDAARKRAERVEELERTLEIVKSERARLSDRVAQLEEKAAQSSSRAQALEHELAAMHEAYGKRTGELGEHEA